MNKYIIVSIVIAVLVANSSNAQENINPNTKHDWENSRYRVNADNTVFDTKTKLTWKRCPQGLSGENCTTGILTLHPWEEGLELANNSTFAGFSDWRLPNIKELLSLSAYDRYLPNINSEIFPNTPSSSFWSSSSVNLDGSWDLSFSGGYSVPRTNTLPYYVRLVRGENY